MDCAAPARVVATDSRAAIIMLHNEKIYNVLPEDGISVAEEACRCSQISDHVAAVLAQSSSTVVAQRNAKSACKKSINPSKIGQRNESGCCNQADEIASAGSAAAAAAAAAAGRSLALLPSAASAPAQSPSVVSIAVSRCRSEQRHQVERCGCRQLLAPVNDAQCRRSVLSTAGQTGRQAPTGFKHRLLPAPAAAQQPPQPAAAPDWAPPRRAAGSCR